MCSHVIKNRIPVDVGVLCSFMEYLCGAFLVAIRLQKRQTLHNLTLPMSWLMRLFPQIKSWQARDTQLSFMFKKNMGEFLEQVYSGACECQFSCHDWLIKLSDLRQPGFFLMDVIFKRFLPQGISSSLDCRSFVIILSNRRLIGNTLSCAMFCLCSYTHQPSVRTTLIFNQGGIISMPGR